MKDHAQDGAALEHALYALSVCAPDETRRARAALEIALLGVRTSPWPEVAWAFSRLTPNGFPLELTFSSVAGRDIRYAVETSGPETPEAQRLDQAVRVYETLAGHRVSESAAAGTVRALAEIQRGRPLDYGAGLGGVHGPAGDRYKIYAEVPRGASLKAVAAGAWDDTEGFPLPHCRSVPVMFGVQPDSDLREVYFRAQGVADADLGRLLWHCGLDHRYHDALELVEATWSRSGLPPAIAGFSIAFRPGGNFAAVSLFAPAELLCGGDACVRRTLLKLGQSRSWDLSLYEQLSAAFGPSDEQLNRHGILAWIIPAQGPVELRIGMWLSETNAAGKPVTQAYAGQRV